MHLLTCMGFATLLAACSASAAEAGTADARSRDERIAAAAAVPYSAPADFKPGLDPKSIKSVLVTLERSAYFADVNDIRFRRPPIRPLSEKLQEVTGDEFETSSAWNLCHSGSGPCTFEVTMHVVISQPTPDSYNLALTVQAGGSIGTWGITRPFSDLDIWPGGGLAGQTEATLVGISISRDLDRFGREACEAIFNDTCPSGLRK